MSSSQRTDSLNQSVVGQTWANSGTGAVSGRYGNIQIFEDGTTFSDLVMPNADNITIAEGVTYNKGEQIVGKVTNFTVSAGVVCAHKY